MSSADSVRIGSSKTGNNARIITHLQVHCLPGHCSRTGVSGLQYRDTQVLGETGYSNAGYRSCEYGKASIWHYTARGTKK